MSFVSAAFLCSKLGAIGRDEPHSTVKKPAITMAITTPWRHTKFWYSSRPSFPPQSFESQLAHMLGYRNVNTAAGTESSMPSTTEPSFRLPSLPSKGASWPDVKTCLAFERDGHVLTRGLLTASEVAAFSPALRAAAMYDETAAHEHATQMNNERGSKPFLQTFNPHRATHVNSDAEDFTRAVKFLATSPRLGAVAARLLDVPRVRLYQSALFRKRPGDGPTRWHADLHTAPIDSNAMCTCWLALHAVPAPQDGGSALVFASRSHRDMAAAVHGATALSQHRFIEEDFDDEDTKDATDLDEDLWWAERYDFSDHGALAPGDATWHHGWTLHAAMGIHADVENGERLAFAITYVADGVRALDPNFREEIEDEDTPSYAEWIDEVDPALPIDHPLVPLVYDADGNEVDAEESPSPHSM